MFSKVIILIEFIYCVDLHEKNFPAFQGEVLISLLF